MLGALKDSLSVLVRKPYLLIPALAVAVISVFLADAATWPAFEMLFDFVIEQEGLYLTLPEMLAAMYHLYLPSLLFFFGLLFLGLVMSAFLLFFSSKFAMHHAEKGVFSESLKYAFSRLGGAIGLVIFVLVCCFFAGLFLFGLLLVMPVGGWLGMLIMLFFGALFFLAFIKLFLYAVPAMVLDDLKLRPGISKSWDFTSKRLLGTVLSLVVVFLILLLIVQAGVSIIEEMEPGIVTFAVAALFNSVVFAFGALFFAFYYFNNSTAAKSKPKPVKRHRHRK